MRLKGQQFAFVALIVRLHLKVLLKRRQRGFERAEIVGAVDKKLGLERAQAIGLFGRPAVLLQRHMEVAAAKSERTQARASRMILTAHPGARFGVEVEGALVDAHLRVGLAHLDGGREHLVMQRHHHFKKSGGAGGSLGVADLTLYRAQRAPWLVAGFLGVFSVLLVFVAAKRQAKSLKFGGVAGAGAGAVRLDKLNGLGGKAGALVRATQRFGLTLGERRVHRQRATVGRRAQPADHRVDLIPVALRILQALHRKHPHALAHQRAVGTVGEGAAVAAGGERRGFGETHVHEDVVKAVHPTGDYDIGVPEIKLIKPHRHRRE